MPSESERAERIAAVLHVLYLIFTEGTRAPPDRTCQRIELTRKRSGSPACCTGCARRPRGDRLLASSALNRRQAPARPGRTSALPMLSRTDRWNTGYIAEGLASLGLLPRGPVATDQVQAAIAALHDERPTAERQTGLRSCASMSD